MPMGKGTYGSKRGKPSKKTKTKMTPAMKKKMMMKKKKGMM
tara:strand:+ start:547 stop:669 length:123 start_codon:yes stop_codon:yes gene_type:complete